VAGVAGPGNEVRALITLLSGQVSDPQQQSAAATWGRTGHRSPARPARTQVLDALGFAYAELKGADGDTSNWRWGRVHTITMQFIVPGYPLIDPASAPDPIPRPGGAGRWTWARRPAGPRATSPSLWLGRQRPLARGDGRTVDHTLNQLPGVESGGPYPFGQSTMLTDWVQNKYFNWPHNAADVTVGPERDLLALSDPVAAAGTRAAPRSAVRGDPALRRPAAGIAHPVGVERREALHAARRRVLAGPAPLGRRSPVPPPRARGPVGVPHPGPAARGGRGLEHSDPEQRGAGLRVRTHRTVRATTVAAIMALDTLLLTVLLALSGGPSNPFSVLYLVDVALGRSSSPRR
jgi:hypothetical protein